jgi:hypothetical protein
VLGKPEQVVKSGRSKTGDDADDGAKKKQRSEIYKVADRYVM